MHHNRTYRLHGAALVSRLIPIVIPDRIRSQLRHVQVGDAVLSLDHFPDFLIVGPQRTGTTWLHANLRFHPEIFLSEPKELFFFSRLKSPEHPKFQSNDLAWYLRFFRDPFWRWAAKQLICLRTHGRFYHPRVRGEATASYAVLDRDVIAEITALRPEIKVILMVRNPIERAWSHAKKDLVRNRGRRFEDVSEAEFQAFFTDEYQLRCARYIENIDNWKTYLQPEHLLVAMFDDIESRPEDLLLEVLRFLGVSADRRYVPAEAKKAVNPTMQSRVPVQYRRFLEELLRDDLLRLRERFGVSWS